MVSSKATGAKARKAARSPGIGAGSRGRTGPAPRADEAARWLFAPRLKSVAVLNRPLPPVEVKARQAKRCVWLERRPAAKTQQSASVVVLNAPRETVAPLREAA